MIFPLINGRNYPIRRPDSDNPAVSEILIPGHGPLYLPEKIGP